MIARWTATLHPAHRLLLAGLLALGGLTPLAGLAQPAPSNPSANARAVLLRTKDSGPLVNQLQTDLANVGLFDGVVDGHYGTDTAAAVRSLQAQQGLIVDGIVGPQTWLALEVAHRAIALPPPLLTANLVTFSPLVVAQPDPPPPAFWLAMMPLVPITGGALTCLHRRRQRGQPRHPLPFKPKL